MRDFFAYHGEKFPASALTPSFLQTPTWPFDGMHLNLPVCKPFSGYLDEMDGRRARGPIIVSIVRYPFGSKFKANLEFSQL